MGPYHDFLLLDRQKDGEWELTKFIHDPRAVRLEDDFVRYIEDTLAWIPTLNPARREPHHGLCMWGPTVINVEGAAMAQRVFGAWADLFAAGPQVLSLTGTFSWAGDFEAPSGSDVPRTTQLDGGYDSLEFERDRVVAVLREIAGYAAKVKAADGRLYLLHQGV